ncbi:cupin domain-containing protein [Sphingomonas sp. 3P27F8]|uniref:cupin domain-containing protein n=1 Tax=Sphingomonas sp. 3P27F8 TaxID=2502213 RepID=UPI0010F89C82|nr:cupin domain-containing protein [Sphingomonas sp. 3P27F8]
MLKSVLAAGLIVAAEGAPASAPDTAPVYATRADIELVQAKAAAAVLPGHGTSSKPLMALGSYTAKLEYHVGPNIANAHGQQAELFEVREGSGTLITGGTIVKTAAGSTIVGGTARHVGAGDFFIVPEGLPHWFSQVDGHLVMISVMLPRPAAAPAN